MLLARRAACASTAIAAALASWTRTSTTRSLGRSGVGDGDADRRVSRPRRRQHRPPRLHRAAELVGRHLPHGLGLPVGGDVPHEPGQHLGRARRDDRRAAPAGGDGAAAGARGGTGTRATAWHAGDRRTAPTATAATSASTVAAPFIARVARLSAASCRGEFLGLGPGPVVAQHRRSRWRRARPARPGR